MYFCTHLFDIILPPTGEIVKGSGQKYLIWYIQNMDLEIILLIAILVFVVGIAHFLDKLQKKVDKIESRLNKDKPDLW